MTNTNLKKILDKGKLPPEKPSSRGFWKSFIIAFFISGFFSLGINIWHTIDETNEKIWNRYNSPYDTKKEFLQLMWLARARIYLEEIGFKNNGIILTPIEEYSKKLYLSAKSKIPEDDIAWIEYLFWYKFIPLKDTKITNKEKVELLKLAQPLLTNPTKIVYLDKIFRFRLITRFIHYFGYGADSILLQNLYILACRATEKINLADFTDEKYDDYDIPFDLYLTKLMLGLYLLENKVCYPKIINEMINDINTLDKLEKEISKLEDSKNDNIMVNNLQGYMKGRQRTIKLLKQNCGTNLNNK